MSNSAMSVVILAAGKGTRMYSDLPKVLHTLAGKPMVQHVIDAANKLGAQRVNLVYGHGGDLLKQTLNDGTLNWVLQAEQLGTGHAMQMAAPFFADDEDILMLYGDVPLISVETLTRLRAAKPQGGIGLLTVVLDDPTGYGRITRENGNVTGIVEHKDASDEQDDKRRDEPLSKARPGVSMSGTDPRPINRHATLMACAAALHGVGRNLHRGSAAILCHNRPRRGIGIVRNLRQSLPTSFRPTRAARPSRSPALPPPPDSRAMRSSRCAAAASSRASAACRAAACATSCVRPC